MRRATATAAAVAVLVAAAPALADVSEVGGLADTPMPAPGCPANCSAIGRVTGYQVQVGTHKNPFQVRQAGKVVAFTIRLGSPTAAQTKFFVSTFGGQPQARLSILKPLTKGRGYTLVAQSELFNLAPYLGSAPTFALSTPLVAPARTIIALTVPTWAPAFATTGLGSDEIWRSPRTTCSNNTQPATQQLVGTTRQYACAYKAARLLYSASFVPDPAPTTTPPKTQQTTTTPTGGTTKTHHRTVARGR